jgi:iron complex transport system ATP-binding protein
MNAVTVDHLNVRWRKGLPHVLHDLSAQAPAAQWTAVIGPNGAGKSTLLRAVAGLLPPTAECTGNIDLGERPLRQWPRTDLARHLAWLGQGEHGGDALSASDVVRLGRLPHQGWWPQASSELDQAAIQQAMLRTECWHLRHTPMADMSGGERQRVRLARVLAVQARLLLMDEPLANLDPPHQADWLNQVHHLTAQGVTVVSVLHELNIALQADHVWLVNHGQVVAQGRANDAWFRDAVVQAFEGRIGLHPIHGQWVALPLIGAVHSPPAA